MTGFGPGTDAAAWEVGDRVMIDPAIEGRGMLGEKAPGAAAEYLAVPLENLVRIPEGVSFEQAAALPVAYGTALRMIEERARVQPGETVLVLGATGGVGSCCVQLCKRIGARVIATGGSARKQECLGALGADHALPSRSTEMVRQVREIAGRPRYGDPDAGGVDVVINYIGGATWAASLKVLRYQGRMVTCGATAGYDPPTDIRYIWSFEQTIIGSDGWSREGLTRLLDMVAAGELEPAIHSVRPIGRIRARCANSRRGGIRKIDPDPVNYPIARKIPRAVLDAEADRLADLARAPVHRKLGGYARLAGPGFMGAALTLGAGTLTSSMLSGATFGYRTLWLIWLSAGLGLFMMAAMARFTCRGGFRVIQVQNRRHSWLIGSLMTALVGTAAVAVIFNFGQVALGTHLIESLAPFAGFSFPAEVNWIIYAAVTSWLILSYGRRGGTETRLVEAVMKGAIAAMIVGFGAVLLLVGVDWGAAARGFFVPWLPGGGEGLDLFIASSAAAVGVMDWVFFHYAGWAGAGAESTSRWPAST